MKFSIDKTELQNCLAIVQKGVSTRSTLPVLSGILIEAAKDSIILQSTDLDLSIQMSAPALIEEEGRTVVPGKLFSDIIKSMPDAAVHVTAQDAEVKVTCDKSTFSVKTLAAEDFPGFPKVETTQSIEIPFSQFANMVKKVARVVSRDESRIILTGILVSVEDGKLRMVATDSYRLAMTEVTSPQEGADEFSAVISGSFMNEVASLPATDEVVKIALSDNQIVVNCGSTVFINRRLEGNYPNYKQLLPETFNTRAVVPLPDLTASVKRAALLSSTAAPIKFDLNIDSQTLQITVTSPDVGSVQETIVCEIEGEDVEIAFNSSYVTEGLTSAKGEAIAFEVQSSLKPGIFKATGDDDFLYLIMPVRL